MDFANSINQPLADGEGGYQDFLINNNESERQLLLLK